MATVKPSLSYSSGLWLFNLGTYLKQAYVNISPFSSYSYGKGK